MSIQQNLLELKSTLPSSVTLVVVSKTFPVEDIREAYNAGQRDFGENRVQEMTEKQPLLPEDVRWHQIGHLQTNKVKYIAPFVYLIHSVDSEKLIKEINKQAIKVQRTISVLLQIHIAEEEQKFGFDFSEAEELLKEDLVSQFPNIRIIGLMGMATFTDDSSRVRKEFSGLHDFYQKLKAKNPQFTTLSMGMSGDYHLAIQEGSTMIRVGSKIFGRR